MRKLLRLVNSEIADLARRRALGADEAVSFVCECGRRSCRCGPVFLSLREFDGLLDTGGACLVRSGHEAPDDHVLRHLAGAVLVSPSGARSHERRAPHVPA